MYQNKLHELCTPEIQEGLLTLRIYREDIAFWEEHEAEFEHLVRKFMTDCGPLLPAGELH
jgi:hypothetical protein